MQIQKTIKFKIGEIGKKKQDRLDFVLSNGLGATKERGNHKLNCKCDFCLGKYDFKKGETPRRGKYHTEKTKKIMSIKKLGKKRPDLSIILKGRVSPRKGMKLSEETIKKIKRARTKQIHPLIGMKFPKEWIENLSKSHKGLPSGMKGKIHNKESRIKIKEARAKQILPIKDTKIEIKVQNFLKQLGIEHFTHFWVNEIEHKYQCDIFIPIQSKILEKIIIECDGDWFHGNPNKYPEEKLIERQRKQKEKDELRTKELLKKGFRVIRFWESEINEIDIDRFKQKIKSAERDNSSMLEDNPKICELNLSVSHPNPKGLGIQNTDIL